MRILVVDDDSGTLTAFKAGLASRGFEVHQALTGYAALAILAAKSAMGQPIDLMLTDLRMPGISGLDLLAQARDKHPNLKTVLMTAYGGETVVEEAARLGCLAVLEKPFRMEQVVRVIEHNDGSVEMTAAGGGLN